MLNRRHGGDVWKHIRNPGRQIIDFSANINPLRLPEIAKRAISKNIDKLVHYPEPESESLKKALASFHGISPDNLIIGNGSIEFIYLIPRALMSRNILIPVPSFSEYEFSSRIQNNSTLFFVNGREDDNFRIDVSAILKLLPKVELVFLCNPNNPTGLLLPPEEMSRLIYASRRYKTTLVMDEAFMDFVPENEKTSLIKESIKNRNILVLRSLTKFFALAGLRLGYLVGDKNTIGKLSGFQYPWNVNSLAQIAAEAVIKDSEYIKRTELLIMKEKVFLFNNLSRIKGINTYPSNANFILFKLKSKRGAMSLCARLFEKDIVIRSCSNFRGLNDRFFRVAVRKRADNIKLITAIREILK